MRNLHSPEWAPFILQLLVSAFLAVLFLQSGLDKVIDRKGNRAYLDEHFARSPLATGIVSPPSRSRISGSPGRGRAASR